ncbi:MAG: N-acyl homoserine lactonase family protein [Spirochaetales bacterium]|nr:N-acyl homoserine lactonase family protein [Spirochaetales bacterium]
MAFWKITTLYYGLTSGKTKSGLDWAIPWLGFYLTDGNYKILCDTGVKRGFFKDNLSPWDNHAEGDETHVLRALEGIGVRPEEIDYVIYTHFHWDHVGNCHLFPRATHIFQDDEWKELIDPLPSMEFYRMYDQRVIPELKKLTCERIYGDVRFLDGLEMYLTPGHTAGSQVLRVNTRDGIYIIAGDLICTYLMAFPEISDWTTLDGKCKPVHPEVRKQLQSAFTVTIFDHYAWFRSQYRVKGMITEPRQILPGHEPSIMGKTFG